jgi:hypothetical protein
MRVPVLSTNITPLYASEVRLCVWRVGEQICYLITTHRTVGIVVQVYAMIFDTVSRKVKDQLTHLESDEPAITP